MVKPSKILSEILYCTLLLILGQCDRIQPSLSTQIGTIVLRVTIVGIAERWTCCLIDIWIGLEIGVQLGLLRW